MFCTAATALFTTVRTLSIAAFNRLNLQLPQPSPFTALLERFLKTQNLQNHSLSIVNNTRSPRSTQKSKTFSIRNALWVTKLIKLIINCRQYCFGLLGLISAVLMSRMGVKLKSHPKCPTHVVHLSHARVLKLAS